ncbi:MAG: transporter, partial [Saprospiraceae bacterium]
MAEHINQDQTDLKKRELDAMCVNESQLSHPWFYNLKYLVVGVFFGILFVKAEIVSWYRIQEMFRLQSFHMYGIIGSAIAVGAISVWLI